MRVCGVSSLGGFHIWRPQDFGIFIALALSVHVSANLLHFLTPPLPPSERTSYMKDSLHHGPRLGGSALDILPLTLLPSPSLFPPFNIRLSLSLSLSPPQSPVCGLPRPSGLRRLSVCRPSRCNYMLLCYNGYRIHPVTAFCCTITLCASTARAGMRD